MPVGMVVHQAAAQPEHAVEPEVGRELRLDLAAREEGVAVGVHQTLLGGDDEAGAVDVDRPAFEDPLGAADVEADSLGQPPADQIVTRKVVFPAPAVEREAHRPRRAGAPDHDRPRVAKPDVAEFLLHDRREGCQRPSRRSGLGVGGDEMDLLAFAVLPDRAGEGRDLLAGGFEIVLPQVRMARKADPDEGVRRPFGGLAVGHYCPARERSRMARNSSPGSQLGQSRLVASSRPTR